MESKGKVDVIFNTTLICPWDCDICCVDAVHVGKTGNKVSVRSDNLEVIETFSDNMNTSIYEQAAEERIKRGESLV